MVNINIYVKIKYFIVLGVCNWMKGKINMEM